MLQDWGRVLPLLSVMLLLNGCARDERSGGVAEEPRDGGLSSWDDPHRQTDHDNLYPSVVLIKSAQGFCSGVVVAPRLVLTAAHCFCPPGSNVAEKGDASSCREHAMAVSYFYGRVGEEWEPALDSSPGTVEIHPEFREETRAVGDKNLITRRVADLAVVLLEKQLENTRAEGRLRSEEVSLKDELILVGYGAKDARGSDGGQRRWGRNAVSDLRVSPNGQGREMGFRLPGAHAHPGDSGAPCFLEGNGVRWLVGISSGYVNQGAMESWFTSTSSYRGWIEGRVEESRKLGAP